MSILPEGEQLRKAVKWVSDARLDNPEANLCKLIEEDFPPVILFLVASISMIQRR